MYVLYPSPHLPVLASDLQQIAVVSCDHQHSVLEREMGGEVGIGGSVVGLEGRKWNSEKNFFGYIRYLLANVS